MSWLLLLLTLGSAYLTFDAFRWRGAIGRTPFSAIAALWSGGLKHLPLAEQDRLKQRYASGWSGAGELCWWFLAMTLGLAAFTVRSFSA